MINLFHATGPFRYLLKTSETLLLAHVFRGYRKGPVVCNELKGDESICFEGISYCSYLGEKQVLAGIRKINVN